MKEPASNSLTNQVPHEAVEVPNGGSAPHGSHPLVAEATWKKEEEEEETTRACYVLCSFFPSKLQVLVSYYYKKKKAL